ncbi:MAG: mechanosensitive ion channel family protein, partial [Ktedonobacteraceae bacterium]
MAVNAKAEMNIGKVLNDLIEKLEGWGHSLFLLLPNIVLAVLLIMIFWLLARILDRVLRNVLMRFSVGDEII